MTSAYTTVFDYTSDGWRDLYGLPILAGLILVMSVAWRYRSHRFLGPYRTGLGRVALAVGLGLAIILGSWGSIWDISQYITLRVAVAQHKGRIVVGQIQDFQPWVPHIHGESFSVDGVSYSMWDSASQAFDDMPIALHNGENVRIVDIDGKIVRFEIKN
ncbi:MAG TPA: hypothetical protein VEV38_12780 [Candidatus Eremiobacteraceae bacterium]|nr:hypothetical protein [Candidatus Eremiobacteraceae bacterium]